MGGTQKSAVHSGFTALSPDSPPPKHMTSLPPNPSPSTWLHSTCHRRFFPFFLIAMSNSVGSLRSQRISSCLPWLHLFKTAPLRSSSRRSLSSLCIANVKFAISVSCSGFNSFSARYFSSLVLIQKTKYSCSGCVTQLQTLPHLVVSSFAQFGKF